MLNEKYRTPKDDTAFHKDDIIIDLGAFDSYAFVVV